ncbi:putative reverse transcriptase domain-containing protein [Tanacetum coccineum]
MPSHFHKKFRWGTVFTTGRRSFIEPRTGLRMKRTNYRTRVLIGLYPCHIEEKMTIKGVWGDSVREWKTKVTTKEGIVIKFPKKFRGYKLETEGEVEENEGLKEVWEQMEYVISDSGSDLESTAKRWFELRQNPTLKSSPELNLDFATKIAQQLQHIIPQIITQVTANVNNTKGGNENSGNNRCSYKTFTACNPKEFDVKGESENDFRALLVEEFCLSNKIEKLENEFWNHTMVGANHVAYTNRFYELAKLVPHLVTLESSRIKRYINRLAPQICGMLRATQPTTIQSAILMAGILTNEVVRCGTLTKGNDKRKEMEESSKQRSTWKDNKKSKTRSGFVVTVPHRNDNLGWGIIKRHAMNLGVLTIFAIVSPNGNKQLDKQGTRWLWKETGTPETMGTKQMEGNDAVELQQDPPKVVTGTFSLNNQFATVLFDSGAHFSFISSKFAPLLNVEHCIVNPSYVIEIADGESVEVDRFIRDCKLELGNSLFTIDLIPLGHGSFDVIVGMDWLSKNKSVIMCHEKVVEIPIKEGRILRVHWERTLGAAKALMNAKIDETRISDIPVVRDFTDVFPEDLLGLPPHRQVEFHIDLVPRATPIAKSPYHLAPSEMQEFFRQLQELQDKGFIRSSHLP